jgi:pseudaminic acid cytidylyltransferase
MKSICIIPARGGSKRLPRKNILPLLGKPLLKHVIDNACNSECFDAVIVSSEDEEILRIAKESNAIPFVRSDELAEDKSTVVDVCLDVLKKYKPKMFCCLYATAAMVKPNTLKDSMDRFEVECGQGASMLMGVSRYEHHPLQALAISNDGYAKSLFPEYKGVQSQNYPEVFVSNGTLYWARTEEFITEKTFYSEKLKLYEVPDEESYDIDTKKDYERLVASCGV